MKHTIQARLDALDRTLATEPAQTMCVAVLERRRPRHGFRITPNGPVRVVWPAMKETPEELAEMLEAQLRKEGKDYTKDVASDGRPLLIWWME